MALVQDANGVWKDTPATRPGGTDLNANFDLLSSVLAHFTPNVGGVTKLTAINSFAFLNPTDVGDNPLFKITQNAGGSNLLDYYATDGTTLLASIRNDGAMISVHSFQSPALWLNSARRFFHDILAASGSVTWDLNEHDSASINLTADVTLTFSNLHAGIFTLQVTANAHTLTLPAEIVDPPTIPSTGVQTYLFFSPDGVNVYHINHDDTSQFRLVHLLFGVTGDGTIGNPWKGYRTALEASTAGQVWQFRDGYYDNESEILIAVSDVHLVSNGGAIIRSSAAAFPTLSVTSITRVADLATVTAAAHGLVNGDQFLIQGASQAEYNGLHTVHATTTNTFKVYVKGTPTTPATGTITGRKGRMLFRFAQGFGDQWRTRMTGLILDGQNQIEIATYHRRALSSVLENIEYRGFTYYNGKVGSSGYCRFIDLVCSSPTFAPQSASVPPNFFKWGELDYTNPAGTLTEDGSYNLTIQDCTLFGALETVIEIPSGTSCVMMDGLCGGAANALVLGNKCHGFTIINTDMEYGGVVKIDGSRHTFRNVDVVVTDIQIDGTSLENGLHTLDNLLGAAVIINNADADSILIGWPTLVVTGTHPERVIHRDAKIQMVNGVAIQELLSNTGEKAGWKSYCAGFRIGYLLTNTDATWLIDTGTVLDGADNATVAAAAAMKIAGLNVTFFGTLGSNNLSISNVAVAKAGLLSSGGASAICELFSAGHTIGYMVAADNGHTYITGAGSLTYTTAAYSSEYALDIYNRNVTFGGNVGFYGTSAAAKPTITGSKGGNAALASLLTQLATLGLLTDSTT